MNLLPDQIDHSGKLEKVLKKLNMEQREVLLQDEDRLKKLGSHLRYNISLLDLFPPSCVGRLFFIPDLASFLVEEMRTCDDIVNLLENFEAEQRILLLTETSLSKRVSRHVDCGLNIHRILLLLPRKDWIKFLGNTCMRDFSIEMKIQMCTLTSEYLIGTEGKHGEAKREYRLKLFAQAFAADDNNEFMRRSSDLLELNDISLFLAHLPCEHWQRYFELTRVYAYLRENIETKKTLIHMLRVLPFDKRWTFLMTCPGVEKIFISCLHNISDESQALVRLLDPQAGDIAARRAAFELMTTIYDSLDINEDRQATAQKFSFFMKAYDPPCREIYEKLKITLATQAPIFPISSTPNPA
jgi:hypothetical protein